MVCAPQDLPMYMLRAGSVMATIPVQAGSVLISYTANKVCLDLIFKAEKDSMSKETCI